MFRLIAPALLIVAPVGVFAAESPPAAPAEAKPAKPKKICRETAPRTGSHMAGGRICRTAEKWAEIDGRDADTDAIAGNTSPTASSAKRDD